MPGSRRTNLSMKVKVEIPVSGAAIQIQQQALKFDQIPDSWPCDLESGWAAHYGRLDMKFMDMCQHFVQNQFVSDAFQGGPDRYLFQWDTNVWDTWPQGYNHKFKGPSSTLVCTRHGQFTGRTGAAAGARCLCCVFCWFSPCFAQSGVPRRRWVSSLPVQELFTLGSLCV